MRSLPPGWVVVRRSGAEGAMSKKVIILGGGIAGMTAAHELAERGFQVVVYDRHPEPGGKARSVGKPNTGMDGRKDLPGEHGFRFFPGFYRHVPDTMKRIPYNGKTVFHNLVDTTESQLARVGKTELYIPAHFPATPRDFLQSFQFFFTDDLGLTPEDLRFYAERLLVLMTTCRQRRFAEYEYTSWWDFVDADQRSEAFRKFCADGITRTCVACRGMDMSTRTGGYILLQLMFSLATPGAQVDRVLLGPTNEVWINPWLRYLCDTLGVVYHRETDVTEIHCDGQQITGVTVQTKGHEKQRVEADYYVAALPVEVMAQLVKGGLEKTDPQLDRLGCLKTAWMSGIQFYLAEDVPLVHGHSLYIDSPWALTSVSQRQFWPGFPLDNYGDGRVCGILSVDISDWETKGLGGKKAIDCRTREEIRDEVWEQLKAHLNDQGVAVLRDDNRVDWFLDPDIILPNPQGVPANLEPLLINTAGSWDYRPDAKTALPNLFLAGDYVRTSTDLATMEGANESARRAVNALLDADRSRKRRCKVWPLREPWIFAPLRWYDRWRFRRGLPHNPRLIQIALWVFVPLWHFLHLGWLLVLALRGQSRRKRRRVARPRSMAKAGGVQGGHAGGVPNPLGLHPAGSLGNASAHAIPLQELAVPVTGGGGEQTHGGHATAGFCVPEQSQDGGPVAAAGRDPGTDQLG
jgi:uncharacterized protein with NAD-binding domain and iron-sulfur cluster